MALTLRQLRLRAIWLLVFPFFWFARPSPVTLVGGALITLIGLALRAWAAGTIVKNDVLATHGPYAHTRNPLYLGSFLIGVGVTTCGGHWAWPALFLAFFAAVYPKTIRDEERRLGELFGAAYSDYAAVVPSFVPSVFRRGSTGRMDDSQRFSWTRYRRNREWEALVGAVAAFGLLGVKLVVS